MANAKDFSEAIQLMKEHSASEANKGGDTQHHPDKGFIHSWQFRAMVSTLIIVALLLLIFGL